MDMVLAEKRTESRAAHIRLLCLLPSVPLGGMERAVIRVATHLDREGAKVHFAAERRWGERVQRAIEATGASWTGVSLPASLGRPRTLLEARTQAVSYALSGAEYKRLAQRFGANALLASSISAAFFARDIAKRREMASVFRIPNPPLIDPASRKGAFAKAVWRSVAECFDHLVCNSSYTAEMVSRVVGSDRNLRIIRNFAPAPERGPIKPAPRLPPDRRYVIYLGQISEAKGVDVLVDAAIRVCAEFGDVDFVLAGAPIWRDPFPDRLRARIAVEGLGSRVKLMGQVEDVPGLLERAHVHVCPSISRGDSFPNVILDAKQSGVPSIVFPTAGLPEAIENGIDGVVTPEATAAELAKAILDVLHDEDARSRMGRAALASLRKHDSTLLTEQWLALFTRR